MNDLLPTRLKETFLEEPNLFPKAVTCIKDIRPLIQIHLTICAAHAGIRVFLMSISSTDGLLKKDPEVKKQVSISLSIITANPVLGLDL